MQLPLQVALAPAELALPLARRIPNLELIAIAAPKRSIQTRTSLWDLGGPGGHVAGWGMSGGQIKIWKVSRCIQDSVGRDENQEYERENIITSILEVGGFMRVD